MKQNENIYRLENKKILIVDDDPDTCKLLSDIFCSKGYQTMIAYNGLEAIKKTEQSTPDIIILDIMMPNMDGWETYERIRDIHDIPVIFLSALSSGGKAARALKMGAGDYIRKPFHFDELIARTESLLKKDTPDSKTSISVRDQIIERPLISLIIPTKNEVENLPLVLPYIPLNWVDEVILVDGLSIDATPQVAKKLLPSIRVITEEKPGKGAALLAGYQAAVGKILIVLDADGSNDPREIPRFVTALREGADFVKGSRFAPCGGTTDMPRFRQFGNSVFVKLVNLLFRATFTDLCYGYHAFWRYCLDAIDLNDVNGFEIDTAIYLGALRERMRIVEVPSFEGYRFYGHGKLKTIPDGFRVIHTIAREYYKGLRGSSKTTHIGFRGKPFEDMQIDLLSEPVESNIHSKEPLNREILPLDRSK